MAMADGRHVRLLCTMATSTGTEFVPVFGMCRTTYKFDSVKVTSTDTVMYSVVHFCSALLA
jgi:hypothetical protein